MRPSNGSVGSPRVEQPRWRAFVLVILLFAGVVLADAANAAGTWPDAGTSAVGSSVAADPAPPNPWGYTFDGGTLITNPPATFCDYFSCIASFASGTGYVVQCVD